VYGLKSFLRRKLTVKLQEAWCKAIQNATQAINEIFEGFGRAQQILAKASPNDRFRDVDVRFEHMLFVDQSIHCMIQETIYLIEYFTL